MTDDIGWTPDSRDRGDQPMRFYETIADRFDEIMNPYDVDVRLRVVFEELLAGLPMKGMLALDDGCGTGRFSARARERGATVISLDYSFHLAQTAGARGSSRCLGVNGNALALPFDDQTFDLVISSELVEHTTKPADAIKEMGRVVKKGGFVVVTTPNWVWRWSIDVAEAFGIRAYHSYENWLTRARFRRAVTGGGMTVLHMTGFHLLPFQFAATRWINTHTDRYASLLAPVMINMAVLAKRT